MYTETKSRSWLILKQSHTSLLFYETINAMVPSHTTKGTMVIIQPPFLHSLNTKSHIPPTQQCLLSFCSHHESTPPHPTLTEKCLLSFQSLGHIMCHLFFPQNNAYYPFNPSHRTVSIILPPT